jgi:hypothetical protein
LGDEKNPTPNPTINWVIIMSINGKKPITIIERINPTPMIIMPDVVKILVPYLSESLPLIGATIAIVMAVGSNNKAVKAGDIPNIY